MFRFSNNDKWTCQWKKKGCGMKPTLHYIKPEGMKSPFGGINMNSFFVTTENWIHLERRSHFTPGLRLTGLLGYPSMHHSQPLKTSSGEVHDTEHSTYSQVELMINNPHRHTADWSSVQNHSAGHSLTTPFSICIRFHTLMYHFAPSVSVWRCHKRRRIALWDCEQKVVYVPLASPFFTHCGNF